MRIHQYLAHPPRTEKNKERFRDHRDQGGLPGIHAGHEAVLATLIAGITELELAAAVENAHRLAGHEGIFSSASPISS